MQPIASGAPDDDIAAHRRLIPILESVIPMNNCSQAPQTVDTRAAAERHPESWNLRSNQLPATRTIVVAAPLKIVKGRGRPLRALAFVEG